MRYFAGFVGGVVVAILLLAFQQHLIGGEREASPQPPPVITLGSAIKPKPMEYKPYEPRQAPPEPEPLDKPTDKTVDPHTPQKVSLPRIPLGIDGLPGRGDGPYLPPPGGMQQALDGGAVAKIMVAPQYPPEALRDGIEGHVEVSFTVLPDGSVTDVVIVNAEPRGVFEQQARRAVLNWQFIPKREGGVAVAMRARQVIEFRLPGS